jgi:hypothetical protein
MEGMNENQDLEFEYSTKLYKQNMLPGLGHCECGKY